MHNLQVLHHASYSTRGWSLNGLPVRNVIAMNIHNQHFVTMKINLQENLLMNKLINSFQLSIWLYN